MTSKSLLESKIERLQERVEAFDDKFEPGPMYENLNETIQRITALLDADYPFLRPQVEMIQQASEVLPDVIDALAPQLVKERLAVRKAVFGAAMKVRGADDDDEEKLNEPEQAVDDAENAISNSVNDLSIVAEPYYALLEQVEAALSQAERYVRLRDEATFTLDAGESIVIADKAEWVLTGKEKKDPDGIIYLTTQRVLFEQKETTGKLLGMVGGEEQHELLWELPLDQVDGIEAKDKGMFKGKDMLTIRATGADHDAFEMEIKGADNEFWRETLEAVMSGDFQARVIERATVLEMLRDDEAEGTTTASDAAMAGAAAEFGLSAKPFDGMVYRRLMRDRTIDTIQLQHSMLFEKGQHSDEEFRVFLIGDDDQKPFPIELVAIQYGGKDENDDYVFYATSVYKKREGKSLRFGRYVGIVGEGFRMADHFERLLNAFQEAGWEVQGDPEEKTNRGGASGVTRITYTLKRDESIPAVDFEIPMAWLDYVVTESANYTQVEPE